MDRFVVVGGGILGASTAYHLAKAGARVTLVDGARPGQASQAAAGIISPWLTQRRNKAWFRLAIHGARYYPQLIDDLAQLGIKETGYRRVGTISLHTDGEKLDQMEERARQRQEQAPEMGQITRLSAQEAKALFPPLADGYGGIHLSGGARVDGKALCEALLLGARRLGAEILTGEAALIAERERVTGVLLGRERISAAHVLVTAGAWAKELLEPLGIRFQVRPQKGQLVHLQLSSAPTGEWPVVMPPGNKYILPGKDGQVLVGTTHEDEAGFDLRVTAGGLAANLGTVLEVAPGLAEATYVASRVGFRPVVPHFLPVAGPVPGYAGLWLANGLGSSGLTTGPYLGAQLALLALGQEPEVEMEAYAVTPLVQRI